MMITTLTASNKQNVAALLARLFSPSLFREMARQGRSPLFSRLIRELIPMGICPSEMYVGEFFDSAFDVLKRADFRNEYVYKAAIAHKILLGRHSLKSAVMVNEFRVGNSKADAVIINGTSSVYEIKSERDSLSRLESQLSNYQKVFARVNVIVGQNHLESIISSISTDIGILLLSDRFQISTIREAVDVSHSTCSDAIFDAIRLDEAKKILALYGLPVPNVPNTKIVQALRQEFCKLSSEEAHEGMVQILKTTRSQVPLQSFLNEIPYSIRQIVLSSGLRKLDQARVINALNTSVSEALKWN